MRKLLALFLVTMYLNPAIASNCEIHSVIGFDDYSANLKSKVEQIFVEKGYSVSQAGYLYADYNVAAKDLKVRQELLTNQNLIAVFNGNLDEGNSTTCIKYMDGTIECSFNFSLYKVVSGKLVNIVKVDKRLSKKPWLFGSEQKVITGFMNDVYQAATEAIPNCK